MNWSAYTTHRDPVLRMFAEFAVHQQPERSGRPRARPRHHRSAQRHACCRTTSSRSAASSSTRCTTACTWTGRSWATGSSALAALVMLAALVSGVVMHRKIFRELFTFRPRQAHAAQRARPAQPHRRGGAAVPLHVRAVGPDHLRRHLPAGVARRCSSRRPRRTRWPRPQAKGLAVQAGGRGRAAGLGRRDGGWKPSAAGPRAACRARWASWSVNHVGDANGYVSIYRAGSDRVALVGPGACTSTARPARVIHEEPPPAAVAGINDFLTGLHLQHFEHWLLRWFYVLGGLRGLRLHRHRLHLLRREAQARSTRKQGVSGARWVDALAVTTVTGMVVAALAMLVVNRLLPADLAGRGDWEKGAFWGAWLLALLHAAVAQRAGAAGAHRAGLARAVLGDRGAGAWRGAAELDHHRRPPAAHARPRLLAGGRLRPGAAGQRRRWPRSRRGACGAASGRR